MDVTIRSVRDIVTVTVHIFYTNKHRGMSCINDNQIVREIRGFGLPSENFEVQRLGGLGCFVANYTNLQAPFFPLLLSSFLSWAANIQLIRWTKRVART